MAHPSNVAEEICQVIFHCKTHDLLEHIIDYAVDVKCLILRLDSTNPIPHIRYLQIADMKHGPEHGIVSRNQFGFSVPCITKTTMYKFGKKHGSEIEYNTLVYKTIRHYYNNIQVGREIIYRGSKEVFVSIITPSGNLFVLEDKRCCDLKITTEIIGDLQIRQTIKYIVSTKIEIIERFKNFIPHGFHEEKRPDCATTKLYNLGVLIEEIIDQFNEKTVIKHDGVNKTVKIFKCNKLVVEKSYTNDILNGPYRAISEFGIKQCIYVNGVFHGEVVERIVYNRHFQKRVATFDHGILHGKTTMTFEEHISVSNHRVNCIILNYNNGILDDVILKSNDDIISHIEFTDGSLDDLNFIKFMDDLC